MNNMLLNGKFTIPSWLFFLIVLLPTAIISAPDGTFRDARPASSNQVSDTLEVTICTNETYLFNGQELDSTGIYQVVLQGSGGDSVITLNLQVLPTSTTQVQRRICENTFYVFNGDTLYTGGIYADTLTASNGCDSVVVLQLDVRSFFEDTTSVAICEGDYWVFGGDTLTVAGTYADTLTALGGCDSILILNLQLTPLSLTTINATICAGESFDYYGQSVSTAGSYEYVYNSIAGCDSTVVLVLEVLPVSTTEVAATICAGETYDYNGQQLNQTGTYPFLFTGTNGCDSTVTLTLSVLSQETDTIQTSICAGDNFIFNSDTLSQSGIYEAVYTGINGCDSVVTLVLTVLNTSEETINATICANQTYTFDGQILSTTGEYTGVYTGVNGCDSIVHLQLTVLPASGSSVSAVICAGDSFNFNGQALSNDGVYEFLFQDINGCDSLVTVSIEVLPVAQSEASITLCAGETYIFDNDTLSQSGIYEYQYTAVNGCDSIFTLTLQVLENSPTTINAEICNGTIYLFDGQEISQTGTYTSNLVGQNGCDSLVTLNLVVRSQFETQIEAAICSGETYIFANDTLVLSGIYTDTLIATGGCDSIITLTLNVLPVSTSLSEVNICANETYTFNGQVYDEAGEYTSVLTNSNGCDSIATLVLHILPEYQSSVSVVICDGESYSFNGALFGASGTYIFELQAVNGCDSVVTLNLVVNPKSETQINATICKGEIYQFNGAEYTETGIYANVFNNQNGCDSVVTLSLTVLPTYQGTQTATICAGESLAFGSQTLTAAGIYEFVFASSNGCDSTVMLTLNVLQPVNKFLDVRTCNNEPFVFADSTLATSGTYVFQFESAAGCDSIVTVQLLVNNIIPELVIATSICLGDSIEFGGIIITQPGTYTQIFEAANGCDSTVTYIVSPISINNEVELTGTTLNALATGVSYQWVNCADLQPVSGATAASFNPSVTGEYAVLLTTTEGCTLLSECTLVTVVSVNNAVTTPIQWFIQPNPASSETNIILPTQQNGPWVVSIFDAGGQLYRRIELQENVNNTTLNIHDLPAGVLFIHLSNGTQSDVRRLVKLME